MRTNFTKEPRTFTCGLQNQITLSDYGKIHLEADELVSFVTESGKEYDVTAKKWGFYATPSLNRRLVDQGFKTALVRNSIGRFFVMIVEREKLNLFFDYLEEEKQEIVQWLDEAEK